MLDPKSESIFDAIYSHDLVFVKDCWKLCGDANCCSFGRHKAKFKLLGKKPFQELPIFPGEFEFMEKRGWLKQFADYDHKVLEYAIDDRRALRVESILSRKPMCACEHNTRTTVCRLYPLLPVFDVEGRLVGTDTFGIYDDMERIEGWAPVCQLTSLPFDQMPSFLTITSSLGRSPLMVYYAEAYRLTKAHVRERLAKQKAAKPDASVFGMFENGFFMKKLVDNDVLKAQLAALADRFEARYGDEFKLHPVGQAAVA